jgi:hypothetical protein
MKLPELAYEVGFRDRLSSLHYQHQCHESDAYACF